MRRILAGVTPTLKRVNIVGIEPTTCGCSHMLHEMDRGLITRPKGNLLQIPYSVLLSLKDVTPPSSAQGTSHVPNARNEIGQGQECISQGCRRLSYSCCLRTRKTTVTKQQMMFEARGEGVEHSGLDLIRSNPIFENQKRRPIAKIKSKTKLLEVNCSACLSVCPLLPPELIPKDAEIGQGQEHIS
jgi:hypothetical protein